MNESKQLRNIQDQFSQKTLSCKTNDRTILLCSQRDQSFTIQATRRYQCSPSNVHKEKTRESADAQMKTTTNDDDGDDKFFPDPRPIISSQNDEDNNNNNAEDTPYIYLNDVSRMSAYPNGTPVSKICFPRCEGDVIDILQAAHRAKKRVGIRGTKHSMGGHSIAGQQGWEIDCKFLRSMQYEAGHNRVRCGPGCHWSDLIKLLNTHGKSPRTMQSYCSFSVGGTLAVNAHGITTDYCFAESVLEFRLARINAEGQAEVVVCRPKQEETSSLSSDLFGLALGGYGLFGVITEVLLKVEDNVELELNTMYLKVVPSDDVHENFQPSEFVRVYDNCRTSKAPPTRGGSGGNYEEEDESLDLGKVELKLARLNTTNLESASFYVFRRSYSSTTVSELPVAPREISTFSRLLYKWAMPLLKDLRYAKEESSGKALDWSQEDGASRNQLLFESAVPLSRLYNPLVTKDDTFVLQEFFCPHDKFSQWIDAVKPIYRDIEEQQKKHKHELILLNTTIRYVEQDDTTFLSYSRVPGGVFAFVIYYRIHRSEAVERRLGDFHNRLAEVTVRMGGTFYLPYRKCYSSKLLKAAYPMINKFAEMKELFDPDGVFSNLWFEHYVLPLCSPTYRNKWSTANSPQDSNVGFIPSFPSIRTGSDKSIIQTQEEFLSQLPRRDQKDILRRKNSYRNLLRSKELRSQFRDQFLVQIFSLADPEEVMRVMARAAWDPVNNSDIHIFKCLHRHFHGSTGENELSLAALPRLWRGIQQLREQKEELTRETMSVVSKLGMLGKIKDYVCMGDNGKTVKQFAKELEINGKIWVVHDKVYPGDSLPPIEVVLERGSLDSVAHEEVAFDYVSDVAAEKLDKIPSGSVDLVTMNQGLHHIPLQNLFGFLTEVLRMLKPGGIFITREHDLKLGSGDGKAAYAMLDLAHSVFNAVTGVTVEEESEEIRAFRSILEWRKIIESLGFVDTLVYEIEDGDPTWDEMLCFCKPEEGKIPKAYAKKDVFVPEPERSLKEDSEPAVIGLINALLSQVPDLVTSNVSTILQFLSQWLPKVQNKLEDFIMVAIPYLITQNEIFGSQSRVIAKQVGDTFQPMVNGFFRQTLGFVDGSLALLSDSELQKMYNFKNLVHTTELFLLLPYLQKKVQSAPDDASAIEKKIVGLIEEYLPSLLPLKPSNQVADDISLSDGRQVAQQVPSEGDDEVSGSEIEAFLLGMAEILPGILDVESMMLQSEFSLPQQARFVGQFGGHDLPSACAKVAAYVDRRTWTELKPKLMAAAESGELPTKSRLLGRNPERHHWQSALKTFFKSPKVRLNERAMFGLRLGGFGEVVSLYQEAKRDYDAEISQPFQSQYGQDVISHLKSMDSSINELNKEWVDDIVEKTIKYPIDSRSESCLWDVGEVLQARFGYTSITSRKVDITKRLREMHTAVHTKLANPDYNFYVPDGVQMGWLPIHESLLVEMRNKGNMNLVRKSDSLRKGIVSVATLGTAGNNTLDIKYRRLRKQTNGSISLNNANRQFALDSGHFESLKTVCQDLSEFLESNEIVRADLHPDDGAWTWFKLNEWMQVEILDELAKSLEHTPWYRFPFMEFMKTYFDVFQRECRIVQDKYGMIQAYGSIPFLIDLVPGIVMTILFGQLKLFAIPCQMAFPNGYDDDKTNFLEEVVLHLPTMMNDSEGGISNWTEYLKATLDERIVKAKPLPNNFMVCSLPPFRAFGEILEKIAIRYPSSRVFQISNQFEVQVRIAADATKPRKRRTSQQSLQKVLSTAAATTLYQQDQPPDAGLQTILSTAGVALKTSYSYPNTHKGQDPDGSSTSSPSGAGSTKTFYCLEVHCLGLLDIFRACNSLPNYRVEQVYDFYN